VEQEITKIEVPEIEGPKTVGKIDLSTIDSSTRPKKVAKTRTEGGKKLDEAEEIKEVEEETERPELVVEEELPVVDHLEEEIEEEQEEEDQSPHIENIRAEKLEGPKIVGKIELPVDSDTRPKPSFRDEKRKRKRIPIDKKGDNKHPDDRD